jgi:hypothetical protein
MNDGMIVSRWIIGATCDDEHLAKIREANPDMPPHAVVSLSVMETTASRGARSRRVLCCWAGGDVTDKGEILISLIGEAAVNALMRLPACMDDQLTKKGTLVFRQVKLGKTPLRDKVIDAVLEAKPGERLCFIGDLAKELDGQMAPTFNIMDGEPIILEDNL